MKLTVIILCVYVVLLTFSNLYLLAKVKELTNLQLEATRNFTNFLNIYKDYLNKSKETLCPEQKSVD